MWKRSAGPLLLLLIALAALGAGAYALITLRLGAGDVYPPYSSLRADPLGAKILHDSLGELPGAHVSRWFKPLAKLKAGPGTALFHLGDGWWAFGALYGDDLTVLRDFVRAGGVLISAAAPVNYIPSTNMYPWTKNMAGPAGATNEPPWLRGTNAWTYRVRFAEVGEPWSVDKTVIAATNRPGVAVPVDGRGTGIACRTTAYFEPLHPGWRVRYTREGHPVIMERDYGRGRVVVCAEAYLLSNEALVRERRTELMAGWLAGCTNFVFAEEHLHIGETAGVMTLVNRYGLQAGVLALLLLAGLFVWRQAMPLVPPVDDAQGPAYALVAGRQSAEGLVNLLRRAVPPDRLLETCWNEWSRQAAATTPPHKRERMRQAMAQAEPGAAGAASGYRRMSELLSERDT